AKATTVSDWSNPVLAGVAVTVALVRTPVARACQISDVPAWVLVRFTRLQVRPAPVTVAVCVEPSGPSEATKATRRSPLLAVGEAGGGAGPVAFVDAGLGA